MSGLRSTRLRLESMDARCLPSHAHASPDFEPVPRPPAEDRRDHAPPPRVAPAGERNPPRAGGVFVELAPVAAVPRVREPVAAADADVILTVVSPPRTSAAILREVRPSFGVAALAATEKATGSAAGVATTEPAGRYDPRPPTAYPAVIAFAATTLAWGSPPVTPGRPTRTDRPTTGRPEDATAEAAATPGGSPSLAEPGLWPFAALAEALPFAGGLPFDADALSRAAQGLLGRLEATADDAVWESGAPDFAWLSGAVAALGGAGYAARVTAARRRVDAGPRSVLASWGGCHADD